MLTSGELTGNITSINNGASSGMVGQAQNCMNQIWPYIYQTYSYTPLADLEVRIVANGFLVKSKNIEYVFKDTKELASWITKEFSKK
jgi:hypothetical protein